MTLLTQGGAIHRGKVFRAGGDDQCLRDRPSSCRNAFTLALEQRHASFSFDMSRQAIHATALEALRLGIGFDVAVAGGVS